MNEGAANHQVGDTRMGHKWEVRAREVQLGAGESSVLVFSNRASSLTVYVDPRGEANMNGATVTVRDSWTRAVLKSGTVVGTGPQRVVRATAAQQLGAFEVSITPMGPLGSAIRVSARAQGEEPGG